MCDFYNDDDDNDDEDDDSNDDDDKDSDAKWATEGSTDRPTERTMSM